MVKFKSSMPIVRENTKKEKNEKCERCGWRHEDHRFSIYCYHYSDQDTDYFYDDKPKLRFVPKGTKITGENFYGKIYETDNP